MSKRRLNNTGSIYYRSDRDVWVYAIVTDGKRKTVSAKTQKELVKKIAEFEQKIEEEKIKKNNITLENIMMEINELKLEFNLIKENSYHRRNETIKMTKSISQIPIQKIKVNDILDFYKMISLKYSDSTIGKIKILINQAFDEAVKKEYIEKNIFKDVPVPRSKKDKKEIRALTIDEQKKFIDVMEKSKYYLVYLIALNTGMRAGEILALHKDDIDLKNGIISINKTITRDKTGRAILGKSTKTKTGMRKVSIISEKLKDELKEYIKKLDTEALFKHGNHFVSSGMITSNLKRMNEKYKITDYNIHSHMLRHTFATRCIESGMPAVVLSKILGHSDISTTLNTYTSVFDEFQNDSLENVNHYMNKIFGN